MSGYLVLYWQGKSPIPQSATVYKTKRWADKKAAEYRTNYAPYPWHGARCLVLSIDDLVAGQAAVTEPLRAAIIDKAMRQQAGRA